MFRYIAYYSRCKEIQFMKHVKLYEEVNKQTVPKVGDYVICHEDSQESDSDMNIFLSQSIGVIKDISGEELNSRRNGIIIYYVEYENPIPIEMPNFIEDVAQFFKHEIIFFSSIWEECELFLFLVSNKYNL